MALVRSCSKPGTVETRHLQHRQFFRCGIIDHHFRLDREGFGPSLDFTPLGQQCVEPNLALEQLLDRLADALCAPLLVVLLGKFPLQQKRIQSQSIARGRDVRADDIGASRRTGASKDRQQTRMIGSQHRQLRHLHEGVGMELRRQRFSIVFGLLQEAGVLGHPFCIRLEPVVVVVARYEAIDVGRAANRSIGAAAHLAHARSDRDGSLSHVRRQ